MSALGTEGISESSRSVKIMPHLFNEMKIHNKESVIVYLPWHRRIRRLKPVGGKPLGELEGLLVLLTLACPPIGVWKE